MDLCKLVWLIFRNPIGVNVEFYCEIMGEENLRKEGLNWTNRKVLDLIGWLWEVEGTNVKLSPKLTNIFDFMDFYYKASRKGKVRPKFFVFFFSPSRPLFSSPFSSSPNSLLVENSAAPHLFLLLRFVSWVSTLVLHVLMGRLFMWVIQILRNVLLSWIHVYFIWNIKDLRLSSKKCERVEKLRKQDT